MSIQRTDNRHRANRDATTRQAATRPIQALTRHAMRMPLAAALALSVVASVAAVAPTLAQGDADDVAAGATASSAPGLCFEATSKVLDPGAWSEVLATFTAAAGADADFFPDAAVATLPDLTESWDPGAFPTVRIGIWDTGGSDAASTDQRRQRLAATDCLAEGSEWTTTISHELLVAAAERILAAARLPQEGEDPLVPVDAEADIDVEFYPAEQRVRTILDWSKPVFGPLRVGGLCWIDDVLGADAGQVVVSSEADMDVTIGGEAGCALFQEFLHETGAGKRAVDLLPAEIPLSDGTSVSFVTASVEVDADTILLAGAMERR